MCLVRYLSGTAHEAHAAGVDKVGFNRIDAVLLPRGDVRAGDVAQVVGVVVGHAGALVIAI